MLGRAVLGGDLEEFADGGGIGLGEGAVCHEEGNGGDLLTGGGVGGGAAGGIEEGLAGEFALAVAGEVAGGGRGVLEIEEVGELVGGGRGFGFGRGLFGEVVLEGLAGFGELVGGELEEGVEEGDFALLGELAGGGLKLGGCGGDLLELEEGESAGVVEGGIPGVEVVGFFVVGKGAVEVADLPKEAGPQGKGGCLIGLDAEGFVECAEGEGGGVFESVGAPEEVPCLGAAGELVEGEGLEEGDGAGGFAVPQEGAGGGEGFGGAFGTEVGIEGFEEIGAGFGGTVEGVEALTAVEIKGGAEAVGAVGLGFKGGFEFCAGAADATAGVGGASFEVEGEVCEGGLFGEGGNELLNGLPTVGGGVKGDEGEGRLEVVGLLTGEGLEFADGGFGVTGAGEEFRAGEAQVGSMRGIRGLVFRKVLFNGFKRGFGLGGFVGVVVWVEQDLGF